ncbi:MAG: hypothetical protein MHMPM18_003149 [Marteilia pararefringens]
MTKFSIDDILELGSRKLTEQLVREMHSYKIIIMSLRFAIFIVLILLMIVEYLGDKAVQSKASNDSERKSEKQRGETNSVATQTDETKLQSNSSDKNTNSIDGSTILKT